MERVFYSDGYRRGYIIEGCRGKKLVDLFSFVKTFKNEDGKIEIRSRNGDTIIACIPFVKGSINEGSVSTMNILKQCAVMKAHLVIEWDCYYTVWLNLN